MGSRSPRRCVRLDPLGRLVAPVSSWIGYYFVEGMVASGAFNIADWLRGDGGAVENLVDFGIDVGLSFVWLGLDAVG